MIDVLVKEIDETAVPGGVHLVEGQQCARRVERGIIQPVDRPPERLTRKKLIRLGEGFVRLGQAVAAPMQRATASQGRPFPLQSPNEGSVPPDRVLKDLSRDDAGGDVDIMRQVHLKGEV